MSRWIRKTPLLPRQDVPVRVVTEQSGDGHRCLPPGRVDAGPRSVWECDCGVRWRIAVPYWRQLASAEETSEPREAGVPDWVRGLGDGGVDEPKAPPRRF